VEVGEWKSGNDKRDKEGKREKKKKGRRKEYLERIVWINGRIAFVHHTEVLILGIKGIQHRSKYQNSLQIKL
jgi:hypothetical protein